MTTTRLSQHIQRLYRLPGAPGEPADTALPLVGPDGRVRAMVLALGHPGDWAALSAVWRGVQADLALPAPAIAVNGVDAFELWFSLAEPVPLAQADAFLQGLCQRYLVDTPPRRVRRMPSMEEGAATHSTPLIPAPQGATGNWSAFVAPDLAAVFGDDPVLDLPPGADAQAELLGRLSPIKLAAFENALAQLQPAAPSTATAPQASAAPAAPVEPWQGVTNTYEDPRRFLLDVMNDASVSLALRIEAAKVLLETGGGA